MSMGPRFVHDGSVGAFLLLCSCRLLGLLWRVLGALWGARFLAGLVPSEMGITGPAAASGDVLNGDLIIAGS
jgi:hypothetical protein